MQTGDEICVVLGCKVPLVIRDAPFEKTKRILIGYAVVLGLMNGETLSMEDVAAEEIIL